MVKPLCVLHEHFTFPYLWVISVQGQHLTDWGKDEVG